MVMYYSTRPLPQVEVPRVNPAARTVRKIALYGSHPSTLMDAPWGDPSWEHWGHSSSRSWYRRPMDRYFDLHPKACWTMYGKKHQSYLKWLKRNTVPIYMQEQWEEVPAAVKYPKGQILQEFGGSRPYFTNHVAWMIALAMTEGVTHIGLWGINYSSESEYARQRGSAEYWLGRAEERGIRVVLPEQCSLLREPALLYGYESHDLKTGQLKEEFKRKVWGSGQDKKPVMDGESLPIPMPPPAVLRMIEEEEREGQRPDWAGPSILARLPKRSDGQIEVPSGGIPTV